MRLRKTSKVPVGVCENGVRTKHPRYTSLLWARYVPAGEIGDRTHQHLPAWLPAAKYILVVCATAYRHWSRNGAATLVSFVRVLVFSALT